MKIIAIGAEKGGVGKSTTALYLAARAADRLHHPDGRARVAIVDRDDSRWLSELWCTRPDVQRPDVLLMPDREIPDPRSGIEVVFIDTPPGAHALASLRESQMVVVPCPPTDWGVNALGTYIRRVEQQVMTMSPGMRLVAILPTMVDARTSLHRERLEDIGVIATRHKPPLLVLPKIPNHVSVQLPDLHAHEYDDAAEELFRHGTI